MLQLTGLAPNVLGSALIFLFSPTTPDDYYGSIDMRCTRTPCSPAAS